MKKTTLILLSLLLSLSLFSCVAEEEKSNSIDNYAAPNYTYMLSAEQGGGTVTFEEGHAESAVITSYTGKSTPHSVVIPATITDAKYDVTGIGNEAFYQLSTIQSITLPDSVTFIGKFAFAGCTSLESIEIPASVTYIDATAFYGCTSLKSVTFKGTELKSIGDFAFLGCTALETIVLPEGVEEIGNYTFGKCSALTSFVMPSTLKTIGNEAFAGCTGLNAPNALVLSASIEEIGLYAFSGISKDNISTEKASEYAKDYVSRMTDIAVAEDSESTTEAE